MRRVDRGTQQRLLNIRGWRGFNNPWVPVDETDVEYAYINLQQNVERYTGYTVPFFFRARMQCVSAACCTIVLCSQFYTEAGLRHIIRKYIFAT